MNVLITGANRGLGLGFAGYYLDQGHDVWACYRRDAGELAATRSEQLHLIRWDVGCDDHPAGELPEQIDLLINNAGIYGPGEDGQTLSGVSSTTMHEVFNVDCVGPLRVVQHLAGRMTRGSTIANVSSKMGSSADNSSGGTYAYRAAKAALVIVSKSMSVDLAPAGIHVITLHPGWVKTDMTHRTGLIDVATSVSGMCKVIKQARDYDPGCFIAYDGQRVAY